MKANARTAAISALARWERDGKYINLEVDASLNRTGLEGADRALAAAIIYGVSERKLTLNYEIELFSERKLSDLDAMTLAALRVGLYQIFYMDRIPHHAAVNETVNAAPKRSKALVNALLRRALREGGKPKLPPMEEDAVKYYSLLYSVPEWIVSSWISDYGIDDALGLLKSANSQPPVTLRINTEKISTDAFRQKLEETGISTEKVPFANDMLSLCSTGMRVTDIYGFDEGLFFVQDPASRLAAASLGAKEGETVADVCSAPGGKSFSIAIDMKNKGRVYSFDLHENKVRLIKKGAERLGLSIINARSGDSSKPNTDLIGKCDHVLCDVPCSGLGVIAKKPDIRYKTENDVARLPEIQYSILEASAELVRSGGTLVYSTCTARCAENDKVRERFLSLHPEFEPYLPEEIPFREDTAITLMPHKHGTDGFYIAGFKKK